jgi:hypothetical protein
MEAKRFMKIPKGTPLYEYNYSYLRDLSVAPFTLAKRDMVVECPSLHHIDAAVYGNVPTYEHMQTKLVTWSTHDRCALLKDVIMDVPEPARKAAVRSTEPTLRQRMIKGSQWKLTAPANVMKAVAVNKPNGRGGFYRDLDAVFDYAIPAGTVVTVTGKFRTYGCCYISNNGMFVPVKVGKSQPIYVEFKELNQNPEQIGETAVEHQFVIWDKEQQKYYTGFEYGYYDEGASSKVGYDTKLSKAKKFKRLADVRVHCLIQSGYYYDLPESWGSVPEWMHSNKQFDIPESWEIVKLEKLSKKEVERIELIDTFKRSWKLRALTVKYSSAVRAVYSDLEKKGKLGEYSAMMMFAKPREDNHYWVDELTAEEEAEIVALMGRYNGGEVKIQKTSTGFAVAVKDAPTATMIYLTYAGSLQSVIIDFETMDEVIAK